MQLKHLSATVLLALAGAAQAQLVVIAHPSSGTLTKDQVSDIFLGKSQAMTPLDQPESSPAYADFYKKATGRDPAQVKSIWSRIVFTGKGQAPKQLPDAAAVRKAVAADPKSLAYVDRSVVDGSVKVILTLD